MKIAIYPGTFDPITNGHLDILTRAVNLFDRVIIAVAVSHRKNPFFSLKQRVRMVEAVIQHLPHCEVKALDCLLIHFAQQQGAQFILRGLRAMSDFDYEFQLAGMNRQMAPHIETIFLPASDLYTHLSASMVREILSLGGDISAFVPPVVLKVVENGAKDN